MTLNFGGTPLAVENGMLSITHPSGVCFLKYLVNGSTLAATGFL